MPTPESPLTEPLQAVLRDEAERLRDREANVHSETDQQELKSRVHDLEAADQAMERGQRLHRLKERPRPGKNAATT